MDATPADVDRRNLPRLSTAQAAARLGIRPATLYAYVSRGLLASARSERGGSTFDPLEVEAFAAARRRPAAGAEGGTPLMVLDSAITEVRPGVVRYRGRDAAALARTTTAEDAVGLLWAADLPAAAFRSGRAAHASREAAAALGADGLDRLRLAVVAASAADPLRADLDPGAVHAAGACLVGTMADALPALGEDPGADAPLATRLWSRLTDRPADPAALRAVDTALVLSLDHDLAVSTFAARVAASARADPYACVQAALGAFGGPLHGSASVAAAELLSAAAAGDAHRALADAVARHGHVPGFGHVIHRDADPRAETLLALLRPRFPDAVAVADRLTAIVRERLGRPANLDLALAALAVGGGMRADAGALLFAIGRTAGWIAHAVEEYAAPPLRLRPTSRYAGAAD